MSRSARMVLLGLTGLLATTNAACNSVPRYALRQSQLRAAQLYQENQATLASIHPQARDLSIDAATQGSPIPFHPGAMRYYREHGAWKQ